ncbi:acyl carrier protein [Micromonospora sp. NPDC048843]|uniref:acyl carrier protein n=1 Tax=Micromonospora sp. NPDC048843 TaxID=3155389 RepID=UPI0033CD6AF7
MENVPAPASEQSPDELRTWLIDRVAVYVERPADAIDPTVPLGEYGLDSVLALAMASDIEDHLKITVDATVLWDHPTIDELARVLTTP